MGRDQEGANDIKPRVVCIVISDMAALILGVKIMVFRSSEDLEYYFEGCEVQTVIIK